MDAGRVQWQIHVAVSCYEVYNNKRGNKFANSDRYSRVDDAIIRTIWILIVAGTRKKDYSALQMESIKIKA